MKYKGAVFFDYDGTLADENRGIHMPTEATRRAICRLRENGYLAILATGRAIPYVYDMGIEFDGMITSNGTYAIVAGEVVMNYPMDKTELVRLLDRIAEMGMCCIIDHPVKCLTADLKNGEFQTWLDTFDLREESFRAIEAGEEITGYKLCVLYNEIEQIERLQAEFPGFEFFCQRVFKYADVNIRGFNKAFGVKAICEHFGLLCEHTYAFGDGTNDLQMIQCVGHGVAMGNHAPELEKDAELITRTVAEEGIEWGLKHYGLI